MTFPNLGMGRRLINPAAPTLTPPFRQVALRTSANYRAFTDKDPNVLVAANYLPAPWCYVAAVAAGAVAFAVIALLETLRKRAMAAAK